MSPSHYTDHMVRRLICLFFAALAIGCHVPTFPKFTAPVKPTKLKPGKDGWYPVPFGTSVADLGVMVPGVYRIDAYPWALPSIAKLSLYQQSHFTGKIHLYFAKNFAESRTYDFSNGHLIPDPMEHGQDMTDVQMGRTPWIRVGKTIAELKKNIPADGDLRFYIPIGAEGKIRLPRDATKLTHFTGILNLEGPFPESGFDIKDGKVRRLSLTRQGSPSPRSISGSGFPDVSSSFEIAEKREPGDNDEL